MICNNVFVFGVWCIRVVILSRYLTGITGFRESVVFGLGGTRAK